MEKKIQPLKTLTASVNIFDVTLCPRLTCWCEAPQLVQQRPPSASNKQQFHTTLCWSYNLWGTNGITKNAFNNFYLKLHCATFKTLRICFTLSDLTESLQGAQRFSRPPVWLKINLPFEQLSDPQPFRLALRLFWSWPNIPAGAIVSNVGMIPLSLSIFVHSLW